MSDLVVIIILIFLNGIFSMSEIAMISARKSKLTAEAKKGNKSAKIALKLQENPDRFLSTIQQKKNHDRQIYREGNYTETSGA